MILPIYLYGHPVLRKKSIDIAVPSEELTTLVNDMFETMAHANGVGLAAPQVGRAERLFVIDTQGFQESFPDVEIRKQAFVNPQMLEEFGEPFVFAEGCLSLPELSGEVERKSNIRLRYQTLEGEQREEVFSGLVARVIQHEYDHLEGLVFTDRLSSLKKMIMKRKLTDIAAGKVRPAYKSKLK